MPGAADNVNDGRRRTLAQKLQWLRELKAPRGEQPPSYEATARQIAERTGVSISGPYFWELATGRTTNPKLHHLQALARYFNVPVAYLTDDTADAARIETELELLRALKDRGVRHLKLQGTTEGSADQATVEGLLGRLQQLAPPDDDDIPQRLRALDPAQRRTVNEIVNDPTVLNALTDENLRRLVRIAAALPEAHLESLTTASGMPELLDALQEDTAYEIVLRAASLSAASRQAVLALIGHLHQVEAAAQ
jgi:transcriptional regulator with XRE-family HTH domain